MILPDALEQNTNAFSVPSGATLRDHHHRTLVVMCHIAKLFPQLGDAANHTGLELSLVSCSDESVTWPRKQTVAEHRC